MLCQFTRKNESNCSLNFARCDSRLFVIACQLCCLCGNFFKYIIDEGVEDGHGFRADSSVRVHLCRKGAESDMPKLATNAHG